MWTYGAHMWEQKLGAGLSRGENQVIHTYILKQIYLYPKNRS